jgi:hypothetical protein
MVNIDGIEARSGSHAVLDDEDKASQMRCCLPYIMMTLLTHNREWRCHALTA